MKLSQPMVDQFNSGIKLDNMEMSGLETQITPKEYLYMKDVIIESLYGSQGPNDCHAYVRRAGADKEQSTQTLLSVSCTKDRVSKKPQYFFNIKGNPISFLTGQNVLGTVELFELVTAYYAEIERAVQVRHKGFEWPASIKRALETFDIYFHGLAFACYTPELDFKKEKSLKYLLDAIDMLYSCPMPSLEKSTVKEMLNLRVTREGNYSLRMEQFYAKNRLWTLTFYSKNRELETKDEASVDFLRGRLRLDLLLTNYWFQRNRIFTLRDLKERIEDKRYSLGLNYSALTIWVLNLFETILGELKLAYLLSFRLEGIKTGAYKSWYEDWTRGEESPPTLACVEWFKEQDLDVTLPANLHVVACKARAAFSLDCDIVKQAAFGDRDAKDILSKQFVDGLNNPQYQPVLQRVSLLRPDISLGSYTKEGRKYVPVNVKKGKEDDQD